LGAGDGAAVVDVLEGLLDAERGASDVVFEVFELLVELAFHFDEVVVEEAGDGGIVRLLLTFLELWGKEWRERVEGGSGGREWREGGREGWGKEMSEWFTTKMLFRLASALRTCMALFIGNHDRSSMSNRCLT